MTAPPRFAPEEVKHLEFLQAVIARHANTSFLVKSWAMTVSGAFIAVATRGPSWKTAAVALALAAGFWLLDSYYLRQERRFRTLYEKVADRQAPPVMPFTMDVEQYGDPVPWRAVALSGTMLLSYGVLVAIDTVTVIFLA
ncbi:hypothetical protein OHT20_38015 [Streptomyces caniferus]|uniref:DUF202 domain-containing protein n=1 Tax=Streptomyces caniferus TaxID=285557 RepID=A0A640SAF5_9ACTN|nr:hypothetical protein [Streptomyces caniferus]GFE07451.1 hypothetical protein Scani_37190 [Streptomyces caniferus]